MSWPWVSRADFERVERQLEALTEARNRDVERAAERYVQLSERIRDAKATPAPLPMAKPERDEVFDAIELQSGADPTLRRHLTRWARTRQLEGMDPTDIINAVLHWQADDNDDPGMAIVS